MTQSNRREFLAGTAGLLAGGLMARAGMAEAQSKTKPGDRELLVVVDVQNDFIPGGALAVKEGDQIIPLINTIAANFTHVILTQDWHTPGHTSFASAHGGKKPFETVTLVYGTQVLWPDHCVQGTPGADFHRDLKIPHAELIIRKGYRQHMDSYSAFFEADGKSTTGLTGYVKDRGFDNLYFVGLATDFCVCWSALDARKVGLQAAVIEDACRGIDMGGSVAATRDMLAKLGIACIDSSALG